MLFRGIILIAVFSIVLEITSAYPECANCGVCQEFYKPVCGSDGVTYYNACQLGCEKRCKNAALKVAGEGECQPPPIAAVA